MVGGHGKDANWRVVGTCTSNKLNHDEEPADGQVPVEPVEIPSLRADDPATGALLP